MLFRLPCPACGAEVPFRSATSVLAVCEYCQSTVLREADTVRDLGKMSALLEDYSPVQIGSVGRYDAQQFTVIGRIQLRYEHGLWNEWYLLFDDGSTGWWSDGSGQHVITRPVAFEHAAPEFDKIFPGSFFSYQGKVFTAADVRYARCVAGQGELPFVVGEGWQAKVADYRNDRAFLTLDYSDAKPALYLGSAVELAELQPQLLRAPEQIEASAGKLPGTPQQLDCPACGSPIPHPAAVATQLVCPACHAEVDATGSKAEVLAKHRELGTPPAFSLALGDVARIGGKLWTLIGLLQKRERDSDETSLWQEYLLFNADKGLFWLVESEQGWQRYTVLNRWPTFNAKGEPVILAKAYRHQYDYGAEVVYAAGAFNWRVHLGDKVAISDYLGPGQEQLSCERDSSEITWSRGEKLKAAEVGAWFNKALVETAGKTDSGELLPLAKGMSWVFGFIHLPLLLASDFNHWLLVLIAAAILWLPLVMPFLEEN